MRNKLLLLAIVLPAVFGCGILDRARQATTESNSSKTSANANANKTLTEKAIDTAIPEEKIGIQECDDAVDVLSGQIDDPDDSFVTKAVKKTALKTFREQVKKQIEEQKHDRKQVAKFCKDFRDDLDTSKDDNTNTSH
jgi:hypothetical protein